MEMKKRAVVLTACIGAAAALFGCSTDPKGSTAQSGTSAAKSATVTTEGSTSMEKVIGSLKETFEAQDKGITVTYNPTGSGAGITAVQEGRVDIGLSSRDLKPEEAEKGLEATVLAYDGIAVIVNPDNPINDLSLEQISKIFTGEISNWKDAGGYDKPIVLIGREAGSGTRDGFEAITKTEDKCKYRQELTSSGDVITSVASNPDAIGYASIASVKDSVKTLQVNGVKPDEQTIKDGSYVIQRDFNLVTSKDRPLSESAKAFMDYALSKEAAPVILKAGAIPAN